MFYGTFFILSTGKKRTRTESPCQGRVRSDLSIATGAHQTYTAGAVWRYVPRR